MLNRQMIAPQSIAVVGASNNLEKPGGKLLYNLRTGTFKGKLYAVNPREEEVQGLPSFHTAGELPPTDLAILAIPSSLCLDAVNTLAGNGTRAFIIVSAGFGEENQEGAQIEKEIAATCRQTGASLIGPNCIGVMTPAFQGVFTLPIPRLDPEGVDFISGSGATAVFIMEAGLQKGLRFNHVFSVGNSAQTGVEDVLAHFDETFDPAGSGRVKILYFETIRDPEKLLVHARSLISKGCRIAAIKAGTTDAGSRAATSHTGAMASSDMAVEALFRKAGIVRCFGREELTTVASAMLYPPMKGKNLAIITHAGGPAVMLTDVLSKGGFGVPELEGPRVEELLDHLHPGSSVANPIDLLATGNARQVGISIDYCENHFPEIDGIVVIFGTPGLAPVYDVYRVIHEKMQTCSKPVYPVLPSVTTAADEIREFLSMGHVCFSDEVLFGQALVRIGNTPAPAKKVSETAFSGKDRVAKIIDGADPGYLDPEKVAGILDAAGIPRVSEKVVRDRGELGSVAAGLGYPLAMKVVGPVHKSDSGGVALGITDESSLLAQYDRMIAIQGFEGVLLQPMLEGQELFAGAKHEAGYGHMVLCGPGGIFVEALQDVACGLAPLTRQEALGLISSLRSHRMLLGMRGQKGIDPGSFADILVSLSLMLEGFPEIAELDLNPIMGHGTSLVVADARIRISG